MVVLEVQGSRVTTTLLHAVHELWREDVQLVAALVFVTVIVVPATQIVAMLYVLLPLQFGAVPPFVEFPLRLFQVAKPWGMVEVFILGILVSLVKLAHMAHVITGVALWAFAALVIVFAAFGNAFDPMRLWSRIERHVVNAAQAGYVGCHGCGLLCRMASSSQPAHCPRCAATLHVRKPNSLSRTWALLIAAYILYIPANVLPIMKTSTLLTFAGRHDHERRRSFCGRAARGRWRCWCSSPASRCRC